MYYLVFAALKIYKLLQTLGVTQLVVNIFLSFLLIPKHGIAGAAIATPLSSVYLAIATDCYSRFRGRNLMTKQQDETAKGLDAKIN